MLTPARLCGAALLCLGASATAQADVILPVSNQGALARSFALPQLGDSTLPAAGHSAIRAALDWTNEYDAEQTSHEDLVLDGETQRYSLDWAYGLGHRLDVQVQVPVLITGSGILDGLVQGWHDAFGLPDGGRDQAPSNRYLYQYSRDGQTRLHVTTGSVGLGDIQLGAGWQLARGAALHAMLKLPTGDSDLLMGGNTGAALWADYSPFHAGSRWSSTLSAGGSYNAPGGVLASQQQRWVGFAAAGLGVQPLRSLQPLQLLVQLYGHTQLYDDSSTEALRRDGLQFDFGARWRTSRHMAYTFGIQEDIVTTSSPDISFHLDVSWRE